MKNLIVFTLSHIFIKNLYLQWKMFLFITVFQETCLEACFLNGMNWTENGALFINWSDKDADNQNVSELVITFLYFLNLFMFSSQLTKERFYNVLRTFRFGKENAFLFGFYLVQMKSVVYVNLTLWRNVFSEPDINHYQTKRVWRENKYEL